MSKYEKIVNQIGKWALMITALTPIIVTTFLPFPYVFGKATFLFTIAEIVFGAIIVLGVFKIFKLTKDKKIQWKRLYHPVAIAWGLFTGSFIISAIFAPNVYRAFWSTIERNEGVFGMLHYSVLFIAFSLLFKKKDWQLYLKASIIIGVVVSFFAIFQFFGIKTFSFLAPSLRPGSFIGNPTFLATYLIFLLGISIFFVQKQLFRIDISRLWRYISGMSFILFLLTIFITQTRGAIVGVVAGFLSVALAYILFSYSKKIKLTLTVLIIIGVIFGVSVLTTRSASIWQKIPGVNRIVGISLDGPTVQTRLISLGVSWDAFKEKPIFGWGPENFNVAYNKYYNPDFAQYEDRWFDRAHNKIADVVVMQGGVGIVFYFLLWFAVFYVLITSLRKRKAKKESILQTSVLLGMWVAYFVQNLFVFDQIISDLFLVVLLAFTVVSYFGKGYNNEDVELVESSGVETKNLKSIAITLATIIVIVLLTIFMWYWWVFMPAKNGYKYNTIKNKRSGEDILLLTDNFLKPYNYAQITIRSQFLELLYGHNLFIKKEFNPLTDIALKNIEDVIEKEPYNPILYLSLSEAYNEKSKIDSVYSENAKKFIEKGLELSPERQPLRYQYEFVLAGLGDFENALREAKETVMLNDKVSRSHYYYSLILAITADASEYKNEQELYREQAEQELNIAMENGIGTLNENDLNNVVVLYRAWGKHDKLSMVFERLIKIHPMASYFNSAINGRIFLRDKEGLIKDAESFKKFDQSQKNDMDVIIDLAKKEKWDILDSL